VAPAVQRAEHDVTVRDANGHEHVIRQIGDAEAHDRFAFYAFYCYHLALIANPVDK